MAHTSGLRVPTRCPVNAPTFHAILRVTYNIFSVSSPAFALCWLLVAKLSDILLLKCFGNCHRDAIGLDCCARILAKTINATLKRCGKRAMRIRALYGKCQCRAYCASKSVTSTLWCSASHSTPEHFIAYVLRVDTLSRSRTS